MNMNGTAIKITAIYTNNGELYCYCLSYFNSEKYIEIPHVAVEDLETTIQEIVET